MRHWHGNCIIGFAILVHPFVFKFMQKLSGCSILHQYFVVQGLMHRILRYEWRHLSSEYFNSFTIVFDNSRFLTFFAWYKVVRVNIINPQKVKEIVCLGYPGW